jgi:hypothetical protein
MTVLKPYELDNLTLQTRGDLFLALLSIMQYHHRPLSEEELQVIFDQGVKDPAVIDSQARLGRKAHLLTYHERQILGGDSYLIPTDTKKRPDVIIGSLGFTVVMISDRFIYSTRTSNDIDLHSMDYVAGFNWL